MGELKKEDLVKKLGSDAIMFGLSFSIFLNPKKLN
jgi:hypothetical protein